jgi:hypothetical protein
MVCVDLVWINYFKKIKNKFGRIKKSLTFATPTEKAEAF